ncbi:MAG TPA: MFS transporter [Phenylobacterium sp.]
MRRLTLAVILSSAVGTSLPYSTLQPILPMVAARFGGGADGERLAQFAVTAPAVGMLIGGLIAGWVLAAVGMRRLILFAILAQGVLGVAGGFLDNPWAFLASRLAVGTAAVLFGTACVTLLAELYEGDARAKAVGVLQGMAPFTAIPCIIAAGLLAERFGWRAPFSFFVIFALPVFLVALFAIPPSTVAAPEAAQSTQRGGGLWRLWPYFLLVFGFSQLSTMGIAQFPFLLKEDGVAGSGPQSLIIAGSSLTMGLGALLSGPLQARIGERRTLLSGVIVAGVGILIAGLSHEAAIGAAGGILSYAGCGLLLTLNFTLVLNRAAAEVRGMAVGFILVAIFVSQFLNPLLIAPLRTAIGLHGAYVVVGLLAIAGPVLAMGVQGYRRRLITAPPAAGRLRI